MTTLPKCYLNLLVVLLSLRHDLRGLVVGTISPPTPKKCLDPPQLTLFCVTGIIPPEQAKETRLNKLLTDSEDEKLVRPNPTETSFLPVARS